MYLHRHQAAEQNYLSFEMGFRCHSAKSTDGFNWFLFTVEKSGPKILDIFVIL
jgi:hypothetical protein